MLCIVQNIIFYTIITLIQSLSFQIFKKEEISTCSQCVTPKDEIWLDPTIDEASSAKGCITLATVPALNLITNIWQTGQMSLDEADQCMDLCQEQCLSTHSVVAQTLLDAKKAAAAAKESL